MLATVHLIHSFYLWKKSSETNNRKFHHPAATVKVVVLARNYIFALTTIPVLLLHFLCRMIGQKIQDNTDNKVRQGFFHILSLKHHPVITIMEVSRSIIKITLLTTSCMIASVLITVHVSDDLSFHNSSRSLCLQSL